MFPSFPSFPFPVPSIQLPPFPFNTNIPEGHIITLPPDKDSCPCCTKEFLECLKQAKVSWSGCSWVISLNYKTYLILWRDRIPRPPATAQVWDIFKILPPHCGCPSAPKRMGWQWCWDYVIDTIAADIFSNWIGDAEHGGGHVHTLVGTNLFQDASVLPQVGPTIHFSSTDPTSIVLDGGGVAQWRDLSTKENHAFQADPAFRPEIAPASFAGKDTIRFTSGQYMELLFKAQSEWHVFVVGAFGATLDVEGTFFAATGAVAPFSGFEAKIYQTAGAFPAGSLVTYRSPSEVGLIGTTLPVGTLGIMEWSETSNSIQIGLNGFVQTIVKEDLSQDTSWNPTVQTGPHEVPLPASLGRSTWGYGGSPWDYLTGHVGDILVYPKVLSAGQRIQVLNSLRAKWELGPPIGFPW